MTETSAATIHRLMAEETSAARRTGLQFATLLILPMFIILALLAVMLRAELDKIDAADHRLEVAEIEREATRVRAGLRREAGLAQAQLLSDGAALGRQLQSQFAETDALLAEAWQRLTSHDLTGLRPEMHAALPERTDAINELLKELPARRAALVEPRASADDIARYFESISQALIELSDGFLAGAGSLQGLAAASRRLTLAIELAARERSYGLAVFASSAPSSEAVFPLLETTAWKDALLEDALARSSDDVRAALQTWLESPTAARLASMQAAARNDFPNGPVPVGDWFAASDAQVEALMDIELKMHDRMTIAAAELRNTLIRRTAIGAGVSLLGLVAGLIVSGLHIRSVTYGLRRLIRSLQRSARGEKDVWIFGGDRRGMLGLLARSMRRIVEQGVLNSQIRAALFVSDVQIMIVGSDDSIIYVNGAMDRSIDDSMDYFLEKLDDFDPNAIYAHLYGLVTGAVARTGTPISAIKDRTEVEVSYGDRVFDVIISKAEAGDDHFSGYAIEWRDVTAVRAIEDHLADLVSAIEAGDFSRQFDVQTDQAFLRKVAEGMGQICDQINGFVAELSAAMAALADGDLTTRINADYTGDLERLKTATNSMIERLSGMVADVTRGTVSIRGRSRDIRGGVTRMSERSSAAAAALKETAQTMTQLSATIASTADAAKDADQTARTARENAAHGGKIVTDAIAAMEKIRESSIRISDIVSVIDDFSFQTNLLALNAAVEAARAGEAGKGFSVVAAEVRSLAQRSTEAAHDIKELITASSRHVETGVQMVEATGAALTDISGSIARSTGRIQDISTAMQDVSDAIQAITVSLAELDAGTQENSRIAAHNSDEAVSMSEDAETLSQLVKQFRTDADPDIADEAAAA